MSLLVKAGIVGGLGTSVVVPVALTSSIGSKSVGLLDLESIDEIKKQEPKNIRKVFSSYGYRRKNENELSALSKNRSTSIGANFALGCHKLLFGRSDIRRLSNDERGDRAFLRADPMGDYLDKDTKQTVLGCSTASVMNWNTEDVYEYELGIKRGNIGFLERITVWKNTKKAVSQLIVLKKATNPRTGGYGWFNWYGIQRITKEDKGFVIGNPTDGTWTDLNIENIEKDKPKYFSVWVADPGETSNDKSILKGLGIKTKPDQKLFSSVAKATNETDWHFNFFGSGDTSVYFINISARADNNKRYATYNSKMADEVASFKGAWQDVKDFCQSQESKEFERLSVADVERLRDYCYTH